MQRLCRNRLKPFRVQECTYTFHSLKVRTTHFTAQMTHTTCHLLQRVSWQACCTMLQKSLRSPTRPSTRISDLFLVLKHRCTFRGHATIAADSFAFQFQNTEAIQQHALNIVRRIQHATRISRSQSSWLLVCAELNRATNYLQRLMQTCSKWTILHSKKWVSNNCRSRCPMRCA